MNKKIVIDGRQLAGPIGGVQRSIREIVDELDKIAAPGEYEILVPKKSEIQKQYKNIKVVKYGLFNGLLWEQTSLPFYLFTRRCYGFFPCTIVPLLYPKGIAVIHDIMAKSCPLVAESFKGIQKKLLLLDYHMACRHADIVATDSEFSKQDILKWYHTPEERIEVVYLSWQHILRVEPDDGWMKRYPQLRSGEFYFSLSANRKQKNFKWIYEVSKRNPDTIFAIAGTREERQSQETFDAPNILYLGYISDGEIRSLMKHCKAFLFPSIYEGFGMPPMEALAAGARIIVANASCLPELYRGSAHYIDPYDYDVDLDRLLEDEVDPPQKVLERFGWDKSAKKIHELAKKLAKS